MNWFGFSYLIFIIAFIIFLSQDRSPNLKKYNVKERHALYNPPPASLFYKHGSSS